MCYSDTLPRLFIAWSCLCRVFNWIPSFYLYFESFNAKSPLTISWLFLVSSLLVRQPPLPGGNYSPNKASNHIMVILCLTHSYCLASRRESSFSLTPRMHSLGPPLLEHWRASFRRRTPSMHVCPSIRQHQMHPLLPSSCAQARTQQCATSFRRYVLNVIEIPSIGVDL